MVVLIWLIGVVVVVLIYFVYAYNRFVVLRNRVKTAWSQIDVQLKRRYDLIPNLVQSVKGYMKHEKSTLAELTKQRSSLINGSLDERIKASDAVSNALKSIFAVAESYPDLKASQNFLQLQEELSGTENKIAYARQALNDSVLDYNNRLQSFPSNLIGSLFGFKEENFFGISEKERENVKVSF